MPDRRILILLNSTVEQVKNKPFDIQKQVICNETANSLFNEGLSNQAFLYLTGLKSSHITQKTLSKEILKYCNNLNL